MNEILQDKLRVMAGDEYMMAALRAVGMEQIDKLRPSIDGIVDNNVLGERFRAAEEARKLLNAVLQDISSYKGKRSSKQLINKGK